MGMVGIAAAPAGAAAVQSCKTVTGLIKMSPGLSASSTGNQTVTITGTEKLCNPSKATGGTGAFKSVLVLKNANCATLAKGNITFKGTGTTKWKNGKTTTYSITYHDGTGNNITVVNMTGKATKGLFVGKKFNGGFNINVQSANNNACTSAPFKQASWKQTKAWSLS
jgi:hypothetical protein